MFQLHDAKLHWGQKKAAVTDLRHQRSLNHNEDNGEDQDADAKSQGHMVQCPGCSALPLCPQPISHVVGFTGLSGRKEKVKSVNLRKTKGTFYDTSYNVIKTLNGSKSGY